MGDEHLSDTISIDPKICVDNWANFTTFTCKVLHEFVLVD